MRCARYCCIGGQQTECFQGSRLVVEWRAGNVHGLPLPLDMLQQVACVLMQSLPLQHLFTIKHSPIPLSLQIVSICQKIKHLNGVFLRYGVVFVHEEEFAKSELDGFEVWFHEQDCRVEHVLVRRGWESIALRVRREQFAGRKNKGHAESGDSAVDNK